MNIRNGKTAAAAAIMLLACLTMAASYAEKAQSMLNLVPEGTRSSEAPLSGILSLVPEKEKEDSAIAAVFLPEEPAEAPPELSEKQGTVRVLLYHTHTTEAYRQDGEDTYREAGSYRTKDNDRNIVAVGEVFKQELEQYGFDVIHDTTNHEPPKLATAYSRSLETMEKYADEGIDFYIDMHRDASGSDNTEDIVTVDGERCARMMFVVGKGLKKDGTPYDPKPEFEKTFGLAQSLQETLQGYDPKLMREIRVKRGRYNQHLSGNSLLIEVGHNMNTLAEAKNAVKLFAKALAQSVGRY